MLNSAARDDGHRPLTTPALEIGSDFQEKLRNIISLLRSIQAATCVQANGRKVQIAMSQKLSLLDTH